MAEEDKTSKRGFASMDQEKQREIARKGGASVPSHQRSFSRNHELAVMAGRKGGHESGGNFKNDPKRAAEAGRKGGQN
jgi:general stress protein YciG